ncbi:hypothetical protein PILCRDRAFT_11001 [Piloderma croceum F 1598]|uniref:Mediator of RNA polymerase II transcription subunit 31 n=1 Tax=Piloderma croceum (strain F 1598) TaxID=765440 RepID=A0A0C3AXP5_PILCF|nr:hypothetical protein PILCRDRAFT_11001 [Piloderma croceum F 1598]
MESTSTTGSPPILPVPDSDPRSQNRTRFELELEFVQSLANPFYLHSLAQQGILDQPHFIRYLEYLRYWEDKEYARFIHYPHALHHLELLQHHKFRAEMKKDEWRDTLNQKQFDHWRTWRDPAYIHGTNMNTNNPTDEPTVEGEQSQEQDMKTGSS